MEVIQITNVFKIINFDVAWPEKHLITIFDLQMLHLKWFIGILLLVVLSICAKYAISAKVDTNIIL